VWPALILALSLAQAPKPFDAFDKTMIGLLTVEAVFDVMSTRYCLKNKTCVEGNPLLGQHPSAFKIWTMAGLGVIGYALIAYTFPGDLRKLWEVMVVSIETQVIVQNIRMDKTFGIQFGLAF
jgi:hypothetical protein